MSKLARLMAAATLAALPVAAASPVSAEGFTLFIYETPEDYALRARTGGKTEIYWREYAAYGEALAKAGVVRGGAALADTSSPAGRSAALVLGGYFIIEATDASVAQAWALKAPATTRGGRVDVVAHYPAPMDSSGAPSRVEN